MPITEKQKEVIKRMIMPDATDDELQIFISIANRYDLDPFVRQISAQPFNDKKSGKKKWNISIDRDGYLKIANRNPNFLGLVSACIYQKDDFEMNVGEGTVRHVIKNGTRGGLTGAWAKAQMWNPNAGRTNLMLCAHDTLESHTEEITAEGKVNFWRDYTDKMILKEVEKMVLKKVTGIEEKPLDDYGKKDMEILTTATHPEGMEITNKETPMLEESNKKPEPETMIETKLAETIDLPPLELEGIKSEEPKKEEPESKITNPPIVELAKTEPEIVEIPPLDIASESVPEEPKTIATKKTKRPKKSDPEPKSEEPTPNEKDQIASFMETVSTNPIESEKKLMISEKNLKDLIQKWYASDIEASFNDFPMKCLKAVLEEKYASNPDLLRNIDSGFRKNILMKPKTMSTCEYYNTIIQNHLESLQIKDGNIVMEKFHARMQRILLNIQEQVVPLKTNTVLMDDADGLRKTIGDMTGYDDFAIEWVISLLKVWN